MIVEGIFEEENAFLRDESFLLSLWQIVEKNPRNNMNIKIELSYIRELHACFFFLFFFGEKGFLF